MKPPNKWARLIPLLKKYISNMYVNIKTKPVVMADAMGKGRRAMRWSQNNIPIT